MARERDEAKREAILAEAKRLFSERGFHGTSVADIVRSLDLPVGTVYTYFENKDAIIRAAIEEGWAQFYDALESACAAEPSASARLSLIVDRFLPELFKDVDLITLFLAEGARFIDLGSKLERLAALIAGIIGDLDRETGARVEMDSRQAAAALAVFFLGSLDAVRLSRVADLPLSERDVVDFIRWMIGRTFGLELGAPT